MITHPYQLTVEDVIYRVKVSDITPKDMPGNIGAKFAFIDKAGVNKVEKMGNDRIQITLAKNISNKAETIELPKRFIEDLSGNESSSYNIYFTQEKAEDKANKINLDTVNKIKEYKSSLAGQLSECDSCIDFINKVKNKDYDGAISVEQVVDKTADIIEILSDLSANRL